jgi:hypothetical protein
MGGRAAEQTIAYSQLLQNFIFIALLTESTKRSLQKQNSEGNF